MFSWGIRACQLIRAQFNPRSKNCFDDEAHGVVDCHLKTSHIGTKTQGRYEIPIWPIWLKTQSRYGMPIWPIWLKTQSRYGIPIWPIWLKTQSRYEIQTVPIWLKTQSRYEIRQMPIWQTKTPPHQKSGSDSISKDDEINQLCRSKNLFCFFVFLCLALASERLSLSINAFFNPPLDRFMSAASCKCLRKRTAFRAFKIKFIP